MEARKALAKLWLAVEEADWAHHGDMIGAKQSAIPERTAYYLDLLRQLAANTKYQVYQQELTEATEHLAAALSRGTDYWLWQYARSVVDYAAIEGNDLNESTAFHEMLANLREAVGQSASLLPAPPTSPQGQEASK